MGSFAAIIFISSSVSAFKNRSQSISLPSPSFGSRATDQGAIRLFYAESAANTTPCGAGKNLPPQMPFPGGSFAQKSGRPNEWRFTSPIPLL
jgi:hypothetical protein